MVFYILTVILTLFRIYFSFFYFYDIHHVDILGVLFKPVLKINMGLAQCWILTELSLIISESILYTKTKQVSNVSESDHSAAAVSIKSKKVTTELIIKRGRIFLVCFVTVEILAILVYFIYEDIKLDVEEKRKLLD